MLSAFISKYCRFSREPRTNAAVLPLRHADEPVQGASVDDLRNLRDGDCFTCERCEGSLMNATW